MAEFLKVRNADAYLTRAMQHAEYKHLGDGTVFGEIPGFPGVWADAPTREACAGELAEALEGWLVLCLQWHRPVPAVDGITLADVVPA